MCHDNEIVLKVKYFFPLLIQIIIERDNKANTAKTIAYLGNFRLSRQFQTVKTTADSCRPLETGFFFSV